MKVALCAIVKNENHYIREWVEYYKNLGIDHIYIYDNNDIYGEKPQDISTDFINDEFVTLIDLRGKKYIQSFAYTKCFNDYKLLYDWFMFFDLDEFLVLEHNNIKGFLSLPIFHNQQIIRVSWKHFNDNDQLDVVNNNYEVFNRFTHSIKCKKDISGKSIIRNNVELNGKQISAHGLCNGCSAVNAIGDKCWNTSWEIQKNPIYKNAWLNHYPTKTIGEYIRQKYFRGDATTSKYDNKYNNLDHFFETNTYTEEKEKYAKKLIQQYESK